MGCAACTETAEQSVAIRIQKRSSKFAVEVFQQHCLARVLFYGFVIIFNGLKMSLVHDASFSCLVFYVFIVFIFLIWQNKFNLYCSFR